VAGASPISVAIPDTYRGASSPHDLAITRGARGWLEHELVRTLQDVRRFQESPSVREVENVALYVTIAILKDNKSSFERSAALIVPPIGSDAVSFLNLLVELVHEIVFLIGECTGISV
jgi:hypothetical protein